MSLSVKDPRTGRKVSARRALISGVPPGGWKYSFKLKGMSQEVTGDHPSRTMIATKNIHTINKEEFCEDEFWLAANMQWMRSVKPSRHLVAMGSVADAFAKLCGDDKEDPGRLQWEESGLAHVAFTLAVERYDFRNFLTAMATYAKCCDPNSSPVMGTNEGMIAASKAVGELRDNPPTNKASARKWFFKFYNSERVRLGKSALRYHKFTETHHW